LAARTCASTSAWIGLSAARHKRRPRQAVSKGRDYLFTYIALALTVEHLVLAELLEKDHGQKVGPGKAV
jgi:hypothetical protein